MSHHLVLTFRFNAHLDVIEALNHWHSNVKQNVGEKHGREDICSEEQRFVPLRKPACVRFAYRDVEHKMHLLVIPFLPAIERVESAREGENERGKHDEEVSHLVDYLEDHPHQVSDLSEVPQKVEALQE